jgi:hypothetical protein
MLSGRCIYHNIGRHRPPFEDCGFPIFTDTGYAKYHEDGEGPQCYYPSISALEAIYNSYPNATIVLVVRNSSSWYNSLLQHGKGTLLQRWSHCHLPHFPREESPLPKDVIRFYEWHNENVRSFCQERPSLRYIEVELESNQTGQILKDTIGMPRTCWGKCTPLLKWCEKL